MTASISTIAHNEILQVIEDQAVWVALPNDDYTYLSDYSNICVKPVRWMVQLQSVVSPDQFRLVDLVTTRPDFMDVVILIRDRMGCEWAIVGCYLPEDECEF